MYKKLSTVCALIGILAGLTITVVGQVTGGAVTGVVLDANGAVVPSATVTLRSKDTGQTLTSQTTSSGSYTFPNVPVGAYTITIENAGFQPASQELTVVLNQTTTVNATLQVGGIAAETVTVTAASEALVQSDSSQLGKTYETELVRNLPLFGNQNTLAALSPNVVLQPAGSAGSGGAVGGVRPRYNSFMIDGVDNNQFSVTGPQASVIQEAVQEATSSPTSRTSASTPPRPRRSGNCGRARLTGCPGSATSATGAPSAAPSSRTSSSSSGPTSTRTTTVKWPAHRSSRRRSKASTSSLRCPASARSS
jgi:hypothetical protein